MKQDSGETYWNNRYLNQQTTWDIGAISTPLKTYIDQLDNKEAAILIPGAGNAYEAIYLFEQGFTNVYICDIAQVPLTDFLRRCPAFNPSHVLHEDFFGLNKRAFDLILEQTFFCAIDPALRKTYFEQVAALLKPGGKLAGVLFNAPLNSDKPPYGGSSEEYLGYLNGDLKIHTFELCYNSIKPRANRELFINLVKV